MSSAVPPVGIAILAAVLILSVCLALVAVLALRGRSPAAPRGVSDTTEPAPALPSPPAAPRAGGPSGPGYFLAANAWLALGLVLLIGEWGSGGSFNVFGYGRIEPRMYVAVTVAVFGAFVFYSLRWLRAGWAQDRPDEGRPPAPYFGFAQAWFIAGLILLLGVQMRGSDYKLFGYGRIEPAVYWGVVAVVFGTAGFCLLRWRRVAASEGGSPAQPSAVQDLARVGLVLLGLVGVAGVGLVLAEVAEGRAPKSLDDFLLIGTGVLTYTSAAVALVRKIRGPDARRAVRGRAVRSQLATAGLVMLTVSVGGLAVASGVAIATHGAGEEVGVWLVCLIAVGLLGTVFLLAGGSAPVRRAAESREKTDPGANSLVSWVGALVGGIVLFGLVVPSAAATVFGLSNIALASLLFAAFLVVALLVLAPIAWLNRRPVADDRARGRPCPRCGAAVGPEAPAGLCPRCLMRGALPSAPNPSPTLAFVESFTPPAVEDVRPLFPHLEVVRLIGQGGMGAVYLARQPALDRSVALKLVRRQEKDPTFAERFAREARALARFSHPNIVTVHESGEAGGLPYLVMEFVGGETLREAMRGKTLSPADALAVARQVCDALEYAHRNGVVHRDIKPENILLERGGEGAAPRVKIADFGLAKVAEAGGVSLTRTRQAMGTPHYMAPEQWERPSDVDHRADIYALGVVLYELLTGELPLGRFDPPSQKIEVDVRVDEVVLRALAKEPGRRYQHARDVMTDLDHIRPEPGR